MVVQPPPKHVRLVSVGTKEQASFVHISPSHLHRSSHGLRQRSVLHQVQTLQESTALPIQQVQAGPLLRSNPMPPLYHRGQARSHRACHFKSSSTPSLLASIANSTSHPSPRSKPNMGPKSGLVVTKPNPYGKEIQLHSPDIKQLLNLKPADQLAAIIRHHMAIMEAKSKLAFDFKAMIETIALGSQALRCLSLLAIPAVITLPLLAGICLMMLGAAFLTGWRYARQAKHPNSPYKIAPGQVCELIRLQHLFCQQPYHERNFREQKEDILLNMRMHVAIAIHTPNHSAMYITKALLRYCMLRNLFPLMFSPLLNWISKKRIIHYLYQPVTLHSQRLVLVEQQMQSLHES